MFSRIISLMKSVVYTVRSIMTAPFTVLAVRDVFRSPYFQTLCLGSNSMFLFDLRGRFMAGMSPASSWS